MAEDTGMPPGGPGDMEPPSRRFKKWIMADLAGDAAA